MASYRTLAVVGLLAVLVADWGVGCGPRATPNTASDAEKWQARANKQRAANPSWQPTVHPDPRRITDVARCEFAFQVVRAVDELNYLVRLEGEVSWLELEKPLPGLPMRDCGTYTLDGLYKPLAPREYATPDGDTRTVTATRFLGGVPFFGR